MDAELLRLRNALNMIYSELEDTYDGETGPVAHCLGILTEVGAKRTKLRWTGGAIPSEPINSLLTMKEEA